MYARLTEAPDQGAKSPTTIFEDVVSNFPQKLIENAVERRI